MKIVYPFALLCVINTASACDANVPDMIRNTPAQVIVVGELHGTKEMPAFAGNVVCHFAKKKIPVLLALEIPSNLQTSLNNFHTSTGNKQARDELLSEKFWSNTGKFGMASEALFELLELSRKLKSDGYQIIPFAYDISVDPRPIPLDKGETSIFRRDLLMAANIQTRAIQYKDHKIIVLAGNYHVRNNGSSFDMASFLTKSTPNIRIGFSHLGGQSWNCTGPQEAMYCGSQVIKPTTALVSDGYDAIVNLKVLHASPPAFIDDSVGANSEDDSKK